MNWGAAGSQTFIAATVVLMVATPFLMKIGDRLSSKIEKKTKFAALPKEEEIAEQIPSHVVDLEDHVIVAGYGEAARYLVRVLSGSNIPFIITTLSPDGANEAEAENLPVLRGDYSKQFLLELVGISRAKMLVIADDNVAMAHRTTSVARQLNPTMRIVVRTRYNSDVHHLTEAGADLVIAEELESIVQLFGEVLRDYRISAENIENYEELARQNGYSALLDSKSDETKAMFSCQAGEDCFDTRTVIVRPNTTLAGKTFADLQILENDGLKTDSIHRNGENLEDVGLDFVLEAGDEIVLSGSTDAFIRNAEMFRPKTATINSNENGNNSAAQNLAENQTEEKHFRFVDTEKAVEFVSNVDAEVCSHLDKNKRVYPSADGCEECLQTGESWVHLRICLTCGHAGCCDSSKNKHATAHYNECGHPLIKSLEKNEDWAWCYVDETYL